MSTDQKSSSHGKLIAVVTVAALVIVLALLSAFVWPGWALNKASQPQDVQAGKTVPSTPKIKAKELPQDATELLKAMPDNVLDFARTEVASSANWSASSPLEEYTLTYSTGDEAKNLTLVVAQWPDSNAAKTQYDALAGALKGSGIAGGAVKVSGNATGNYVVKSTEKGSQATAIWQNDTAVFQVSGPKDGIKRFYQKFPL